MKRLALVASLLIALPAAAARLPINFFTGLTGYQEVPSVSTQAGGTFHARWDPDATSFEYTLTYEALQAPVTQAHIHFAQASVNGPIIIWLCGSAANPGPLGTPVCPQSGTVRGLIVPTNVLASPATQQLGAGEMVEVLEAMRAGAAYVNVHTGVSTGGEIRGQIFPGGGNR
jgi:hypothetical protein